MLVRRFHLPGAQGASTPAGSAPASGTPALEQRGGVARLEHHRRLDDVAHLPGEANKPPCYSYNVPSWLQFSPLQIKGVTFANGSAAKSWSVVSDFGGEAEVNQDCGSYGGPFCTYPWYAFNGTDNSFTFGGDYPGTTNDFGQALQYDLQENCTSPDGSSPQYCSTVIR